MGNSIVLDRRVYIEHRASGVDSVGQPGETWSVLATVWANLRYLSGVESIKAGAETSLAKVSVRIRYRADLDTGMRIRCADGVFEIKSILPAGRRTYLNLACESK